MRQPTKPDSSAGQPPDARYMLVSHALCPYVQRVAISFLEKSVPFTRIDIDLANKPDWFTALSPLGKTPVLKVGASAIFESAVILEYLEETAARPLHPADPLRRAEHRAWIEFGSTILNDIWSFYSAAETPAFEAARERLRDRFAWLERRLVGAPWFDGGDFSLVDAVFAPVFRYFDSFERIGDFRILDDYPKIGNWRRDLTERPSVAASVRPDYPQKLWEFLAARPSRLGQILRAETMAH